MTGRINKFTITLLIAGFAAMFIADIAFLLHGSRVAAPAMLVIVAAAWAVFHVLTAVMPPLADEPEPAAPPAGVPVDLYLDASPAALVDAPLQGAAWLNTLRTYVGPVGRVDPESLNGLDGRQLVILPEPATASVLLNSALRARLEQAAAAGAAVIIDNPAPNTAASLGLDLDADTTADPVTWVDSNALGAHAAQRLADSTLAPDVRRLRAMPALFSDWMRCGEHPAVLTRPLGKGVLIVTLFPWARTLTALRQGRELPSAPAMSCHPWQRVPARMRENELPLADLLDAFLLGLARQYVPLCGWWRHPDAAPASLLITAEDDYAGARTRVLFDVIGDARVSPTVFLLPDGDTDAALQPGAYQPGLLWNRYPLHAFRGNLRKNPYPTVADQAQALAGRLGQAPSVARVHQQRFDGGSDKIFAAMQAAGLDADASFGPGPGQQGYVFATGFPFHPESGSGGAFSLLEVPHQVHDRSGAPALEWLDRLVERSLDPPCSPLCVALHPYILLQNPRTREAAAHLIRVARDSGLALAGAAGFVAFWNARARSPIQSRFSGEILDLDVDAACAGLALELPSRIRGRLRRAVIRDGQPVPAETIQNNLLPLAQGKHTIRVSYEK